VAGSITDTYKVRKPNGEIVEVNVLDFNLAYCVKDNPYVRCSDTSWLRVRALTIVPKPPAFGQNMKQPEGFNPPPLELRSPEPKQGQML